VRCEYGFGYSQLAVALASGIVQNSEVLEITLRSQRDFDFLPAEKM